MTREQVDAMRDAVVQWKDGHPPLLTASWRSVYEFVQGLREGEQPAFLPVRTSLGKPRYWRESASLPALNMLVPYGLFKIEDDHEFMERYFMRLEKHGVKKIQAALDELGQTYCKPLVLLCFERVKRDGFDHKCHRRTFAEWWQQETGQPVPEANGLTAREIEGSLAA